MVNSEDVLTRLEVLLDDVWDQRPVSAATSRTAPLANLGVDSLTLALLLEKVGKEFQVDWSTETLPEGDISLRSIANIVLRQGGAAAAGD